MAVRCDHRGLGRETEMRSSIVVFSSLLLAACGTATTGGSAPSPTAPAAAEEPAAPVEAPASPAMSPAEAQRKALAEYAAAWDAGDADAAASFYSAGAVIKLAGAPDVTGSGAIHGLVAANLGMSSDDKTPFTRLFSDGNVVIGEWVWAGTHTGDLMGLPPTQKPFGLKGISIYFFDDAAKLKAAHAYIDMGTLMSQLGVSKQPAPPLQALPIEAALEIAATDSESEQRNLALATSMFDAFEKKSEQQFLASVTDATEWEDTRRAETVKGEGAIRNYFKTQLKAFPDAKVTVLEAWAAGDYVILEWQFTGTHLGALGPIAATKKPVELHAVDILQFGDDGKIIKGWVYGNTAELAMQLGLMPDPGAAPKATPNK